MKTYFAAFLCVAFLGLTLWAGTNTTRLSSYCQQCGMRRLAVQKDCWNIAYQTSEQTIQTGYSRLYFRGVSASCRHQWLFSSSQSSGNILRGRETGCGASPYALRFAPVFDRLTLLDKSKVPAVLAALPLKEPVSEQVIARMSEISEAMIDLGPNPTKRQTEQWWQRHHTLFGV